MGVLHTLAERGLRAGRDIAVVGFDDSQVAQVVPPGLTSVRQPLEEVAVEVVKALEDLLGPPPSATPAACCSRRRWRCAGLELRRPWRIRGDGTQPLRTAFDHRLTA